MIRLPMVALIVVILAVGPIGCGDKVDADGATPQGGAVSSVDASVSADGTSAGIEGDSTDAADGSASTASDGAASGATSADGSPASGTSPSGGTSAGSASTGVDTTAVLRELDAVRRELDAISLPDDTDFSDIEAALR